MTYKAYVTHFANVTKLPKKQPQCRTVVAHDAGDSNGMSTISHLRVSPLPDEIYFGVITRIARRTGSTVASVRDQLVASSPVRSSRQSALLAGLAKALDLGLGDLTIAHTLIPFMRVFSSEVLPFRDDRWVLSSPRARKDPVMRGVRLCKSCVKQDLQEIGFSYWRRSHQIPGVVICTAHNEILQQIPARGVFDCMPEEVVNHGKAAFEPPNERVKLETVQRYCELAIALLRRSESLELSVVHAVVRARVHELHLRLDRKGCRRSIVDVAHDQAPRNWLDLHFKTRNRGPKPAYGLARACMLKEHPASSSTYVLAMALLYEDAQFALASLSVHAPTDVILYRQSSALDYASDEVLRALLKSGGVIDRAANDLGINSKTLHQGLNKVGIISLEPILGTPMEPALASFFEGASLQTVCDQHGIKQEEIELLLRRTSALFSRVFLRMCRKNDRRRADMTHSNLA